MKVLFACGGTGGHIYPALALADAIKTTAPGSDIPFLGTRSILESSLISQAGYRHIPLVSQKLTRKLTLSLLTFPFATLAAIIQAVMIVRWEKPEAVVVMGGFASFPAAIAAWFLRVPILLHDQNVIPGLASRVIAPLSSIITLGLPGGETRFPTGKAIVTGNPLRKPFLTTGRGTARQQLEIPESARVVAVLGGSLGARKINAMAEAFESLCQELPDLWILHVTGQTQFGPGAPWGEASGIPGTEQRYKRIPYDHAPWNLLAAADLAVTRAGAMTISELQALHIPAILIPFPYAADNHQEANARVLSETGAAVILSDLALSGPELLRIMKSILNTSDTLSKMKASAAQFPQPDAAGALATIVAGMIRSRKGR